MLIIVWCVLTVGTVLGDLPVNCQYPQIVGKWMFLVGEGGRDNTIECSDFGTTGKNVPRTNFTLDLYFPDVAIDQYGNKGFWTMVYNQGFEVIIEDRKYFAFSKYIGVEAKKTTSICDQTLPGWSHDVHGRDWECYIGVKVDKYTSPVVQMPEHVHIQPSLKNMRYRTSKSFITKINSQQTSWKAVQYPQFEGRKIEDMVKMAGGNRASPSSIQEPSSVSAEQMIESSQLPHLFDWRDVNGVDYVTPVGNQGTCGSCYIFASLGMMEARWRIKSNNTRSPAFSRQDVIECNQYSQGCDGGFMYTTAGKYGEDFGFVSKDCNSYRAEDGECSTSHECPRSYTRDYEYIGGFFGGCNEAAMRINLVRHGPIATSFRIHADFFNYHSGVYDFIPKLQGPFNPYGRADHAVLIVGYGTHLKHPAKREDYWIVQNSWGTEWGEDGYFRLKRGTNSCFVEGSAFQAFPVL